MATTPPGRPAATITLTPDRLAAEIAAGVSRSIRSALESLMIGRTTWHCNSCLTIEQWEPGPAMDVVSAFVRHECPPERQLRPITAEP